MLLRIVIRCPQVHVSQSSTVSDHCKEYALSHPVDCNLTSECKHEHDARCDRCSLLSIVSETGAALESVCPCDEDEICCGKLCKTD